MSDRELKSEVTHLVNKSGYAKSIDLLCPIVRIVSMRHQDIPLQQISKVVRSLL